ncbi:hypothetical protein HRR83_008317 [Exophiala dermatitidis]|uniref:Uncharacterized protein n=1 Tax=Exophiala dermatitidis TaxID=5970 RepID=A0AAN6IUL0_EXODE|nr:hypothetical protein HRR73_007892 [Exophiala dermatitidis]KAJ4507667.1 hypothetical protein HRR74_007994 [Exophiala dermatitidis]KAJ4533030.1 hypothetical protein HRR76_008001 [Exophiala dermatitidis]KAJ4535236.1 hypothetical protein HRR77_008147 [Exophiala dermatitidis]KAJ4560689.1 hypothetical protein HRR79_007811 [Exophiala dermatitidis]
MEVFRIAKKGKTLVLVKHQPGGKTGGFRAPSLPGRVHPRLIRHLDAGHLDHGASQSAFLRELAGYIIKQPWPEVEADCNPSTALPSGSHDAEFGWCDRQLCGVKV